MNSAYDAITIGADPDTASDSMLWWEITGRMDVGKTLAEFGLHQVLDASQGELQAVVSKRQAKRVVAMQELFRRAGDRPIRRGEHLDTPKAVYELMQPLGRLTSEELWVILLDSRLRVLTRVNVARGGLNSVSVAPRDIFHHASREPRCSAIVLVHNHPSGDPTPSAEDISLTTRMVHAAEILGFTLADHVIVGDGRFVSLAELGHIDSTDPIWKWRA